MNTTMTIQIPEEQRKKLHALASKLGKTDSELVRQMIEHGLTERDLGQRINHLKGSLPESSSPTDALSRSIRERNWRD